MTLSDFYVAGSLLERLGVRVASVACGEEPDSYGVIALMKTVDGIEPRTFFTVPGQVQSSEDAADWAILTATHLRGIEA